MASELVRRPLVALLLAWLLLGLSAWAQPAVQDPMADGGLMALLDARTALKAGDRVQYTVVEDRAQPLALFVDERGEIDVPLLGKRKAAGLTPRELAGALKQELQVDFYHQATVLVQVQPDNVRGRVTVLGPVASEGSLALPVGELLTLSQVILRSGGFVEGADRSRVTIIRRDPAAGGAEARLVHDVGRMLATGDFGGDPVVEPDDVVLVPRTGLASGKVFVVGAVTTPGLLDIPRDGPFTVSRAILAAGGFTKFADRRRVKLVRNDPALGERERTVIVNVESILDRGRTGEDPVLQAEDLVRVEERWIAW